MNALIVAGSPVSDVSVLLRELAGAADLVIAADAGASTCLRAGVTPDAVVGDLDSIERPDLERLGLLGVRILRVPPEKDETDLDLAIALVRERNATALTALAVTGGRLDHTLAALGALARAADLAPVIEDLDAEAWILDPTGRPYVDLSTLGATVSVVPLRDAVVSCTGMRYALSREALPALGSRGVSNVIEDPHARVEVHDGTVLVVKLRPDAR